MSLTPDPLLGTTVILSAVHMNMYTEGSGFCFELFIWMVGGIETFGGQKN